MNNQTLWCPDCGKPMTLYASADAAGGLRAKCPICFCDADAQDPRLSVSPDDKDARCMTCGAVNDWSWGQTCRRCGRARVIVSAPQQAGAPPPVIPVPVSLATTPPPLPSSAQPAPSRPATTASKARKAGLALVQGLRLVLAGVVTLALAAAVAWAGYVLLAPLIAGAFAAPLAPAVGILLGIGVAAMLLAIYVLALAPGLFEALSGREAALERVRAARRQTTAWLRLGFAVLVVLALAVLVGWVGFVALPHGIAALVPGMNEAARTLTRVASGLLCLGVYGAFAAPGLFEAISGRNERPAWVRTARWWVIGVMIILLMIVVVVMFI
jgi:hypothetical protein